MFPRYWLFIGNISNVMPNFCQRWHYIGNTTRLAQDFDNVDSLLGITAFQLLFCLSDIVSLLTVNYNILSLMFAVECKYLSFTLTNQKPN